MTKSPPTQGHEDPPDCLLEVRPRNKIILSSDGSSWKNHDCWAALEPGLYATSGYVGQSKKRLVSGWIHPGLFWPSWDGLLIRSVGAGEWRGVAVAMDMVLRGKLKLWQDDKL